MFPAGTTYEKSLKTVEMAQKHNVFLRTNTVLGTFNFDFFDEITSDLIGFGPKIVNFLPVNLFDESKDMVECIDYAKLRPILKRQIDILTKSLPESLVFVRYMPFCDMEGYERHIVGQLQHIYDWFDWNRELDGVGLLDMIGENPRKMLGRYGSSSLRKCFEQRRCLYEKTQKCMLCKYNILCDGVEKSNGRLLGQTVPSAGIPIKNPMEFIGNSTETMYRKIYGYD